MTTRAKLPLFATLKLTLRWAKVIVQRHWGLLLANALLPGLVIAAFVPLISIFKLTGSAAVVAGFIFIFAFLAVIILPPIYLALIAHNEVLIGPAGFNRSTVGPMGLRVFGYLLDIVLALLIGWIAIFVPGGIILGIMQVVLQVVMQINKPLLLILSVPAVLGVWISAVLVISRLMLRLPSRAIGQPLPWSVVWRMGRENSWCLFGGQIIILLILMLFNIFIFLSIYFFILPHSAPADIASAAKYFGWFRFNPQFLQSTGDETWSLFQIIVEFIVYFLDILLISTQVILTTTFLSLAYAQLRDNLALALAARPPEDPNRPPWEYDDDYR